MSLDNLERLAGAFGLSVPELLQTLDAHAIGERLLGHGSQIHEATARA